MDYSTVFVHCASGHKISLCFQTNGTSSRKGETTLVTQSTHSHLSIVCFADFITWPASSWKHQCDCACAADMQRSRFPRFFAVWFVGNYITVVSQLVIRCFFAPDFREGEAVKKPGSTARVSTFSQWEEPGRSWSCQKLYFNQTLKGQQLYLVTGERKRDSELRDKQTLQYMEFQNGSYRIRLNFAVRSSLSPFKHNVFCVFAA